MKRALIFAVVALFAMVFSGVVTFTLISVLGNRGVIREFQDQNIEARTITLAEITRENRDVLKRLRRIQKRQSVIQRRTLRLVREMFALHDPVTFESNGGAPPPNSQSNDNPNSNEKKGKKKPKEPKEPPKEPDCTLDSPLGGCLIP